MAKRKIYRDSCEIYEDSSAESDENPNYTYGPKWKNVPCEVDLVSGFTTTQGRQLAEGTTAVVSMRYLPNLDSTMRVKIVSGRIKDTYLNISHINSDQHMMETQLLCVAKLN